MAAGSSVALGAPGDLVVLREIDAHDAHLARRNNANLRDLGVLVSHLVLAVSWSARRGS